MQPGRIVAISQTSKVLVPHCVDTCQNFETTANKIKKPLLEESIKNLFIHVSNFKNNWTAGPHQCLTAVLESVKFYYILRDK